MQQSNNLLRIKQQFNWQAFVAKVIVEFVKQHIAVWQDLNLSATKALLDFISMLKRLFVYIK